MDETNEYFPHVSIVVVATSHATALYRETGKTFITSLMFAAHNIFCKCVSKYVSSDCLPDSLFDSMLDEVLLNVNWSFHLLQ